MAEDFGIFDVLFGDFGEVFFGEAGRFGAGNYADNIFDIIGAKDVTAREVGLDVFDDFELSDFVDGGVE